MTTKIKAMTENEAIATLFPTVAIRLRGIDVYDEASGMYNALTSEEGKLLYSVFDVTDINSEGDYCFYIVYSLRVPQILEFNDCSPEAHKKHSSDFAEIVMKMADIVRVTFYYESKTGKITTKKYYFNNANDAWNWIANTRAYTFKAITVEQADGNKSWYHREIELQVAGGSECEEWYNEHFAKEPEPAETATVEPAEPAETAEPTETAETTKTVAEKANTAETKTAHQVSEQTNTTTGKENHSDQGGKESGGRSPPAQSQPHTPQPLHYIYLLPHPHGEHCGEKEIAMATIPTFDPSKFILVDFSDKPFLDGTPAYAAHWQNSEGTFFVYAIYHSDGDTVYGGRFSPTGEKYYDRCPPLTKALCIQIMGEAIDVMREE